MADESWTILKVLDWTRGHFEKKRLGSPRLDAELILAHVLKIPRVMLYARFDQPLQDTELTQIRGLVARRARNEPMAYLLGEKEFWSLSLEVTPDVLIPRPDTEGLVTWALKKLEQQPSPRIADVGTGSGCIALALAKERPDAQIVALERSPAARAVAERNQNKLGLTNLKIVASDLLAAVEGPFTLIAANLPYIPSATIATLMPDVRDFEPKMALDGGPDGLTLVRRLIPEAQKKLAPGGWLGLELASEQVAPMAQELAQNGFLAVEQLDDDGLPRFVVGRWRES